MANARKEFEMVVFPIIEQLLQRTGVHPKQIGILVLNCSLFNPTPSLSAMLINRFKWGFFFLTAVIIIFTGNLFLINRTVESLHIISLHYCNERFTVCLHSR